MGDKTGDNNIAISSTLPAQEAIRLKWTPQPAFIIIIIIIIIISIIIISIIIIIIIDIRLYFSMGIKSTQKRVENYSTFS